MNELRQLYEQWIKALLSDKYKQGFSLLRSESGYCCLGVACDLNQKDGLEWKRGSLSDQYFSFGGNASVPPRTLQEKFNLTATHVRLLTDMNDIEKRSFRDIAAYIEQKIMPEVLRGVKP